MTFGASTKINNNESISADYEGDAVTDDLTGSESEVIGNVAEAAVRETLNLVQPDDDVDEAVVCWIGGNGLVYASGDDGAAPTDSPGDPGYPTGGQGILQLTGLTDTPAFDDGEDVFQALDMELPTGDDDKVDVEVSAADTEDRVYYRLTIDNSACINDAGNAQIAFENGPLMTTAGMLANGASTVTGSVTSTSTGSVDGSVNNNATVYIEMSGHKLSIGDVSAADGLAGGIDGVGFDGIGAADAAGSLQGETSPNVRYDGEFGVAKVAASMGDDNDWAAGFSFSVAPVTVGIGFASDSTATVGLGLSQGQIDGKVLYSSQGDNKAMGVSAAYSMTDATSVTVVYSTNSAGDEDGVGIGFSHDLGGGATLKAGAGQVGGDTKADLGITMSF
jgi:outer membrane protein OmpU